MPCAESVDLAALRAAIGRGETVEDPLPAFPASALAATLDRDEVAVPGDPLPPLWHWAYFLPLPVTAALAENGHARQGEFVPHIPLPRRMFAGARLQFVRPLRIGERAQRVSTIVRVDSKQGRSGELLFLVLRHEYYDREGLAIREEQDIVYRRPPRRAIPPPALAARSGAKPLWVREVEANEVLLFRYSALIFNAHRIHWDRPYAQGAEGYAGLVVHGQLIATWLADLVHRNSGRPIRSFRFRSVAALLEHAGCRLCGLPDGDGVRLWAETADNAVVMEAFAVLG